MKFLCYIFFFVFGLLFTQRSLAGHLAAADINVAFIGTAPAQLKYRITLTVYKLCEGSQAANLSDTETVVIKSANLAFTRTFKMPARFPADTFDFLCSAFSQTNSCRLASSIYQGYTRKVYADTLTLPGLAADYTFSYTTGTRNASIQNLASPGTADIHIEAGLNVLSYAGRSTPAYADAPLAVFCINDSSRLVNNPIDPNSDSLVTLNRQPQSSSSQNLPYSSGFSLANPVAGLFGYILSPLTGTALFSIPSTGKYVLAFRTNKYDKATGNLIGYISRDVQITALACGAPITNVSLSPYAVTGGTISGNGLVTVNAGQPLSFKISASGQSFANSISLTSNNTSAAPGSFFTLVSTPGNTTGTLSWTPNASAAGLHLIVFKGNDSVCTPAQPLAPVVTSIVAVRVLPLPSSIASNVIDAGISIYPNPARDVLSVNNNGRHIESLTLLDMTGKTLLEQKDPPSELNIRNLSSGTYMLKLSGSFGVACRRFVKN